MRAQQQVDEYEAEYENQACGAAAGFSLFTRHTAELVSKTCRQIFFGNLRDGSQCLTGCVTAGGSHHHLHGCVKVETADDIRAVYLLDRYKLSDGSHLVAVAHLDAGERFQVLGCVRFGLNHDTVHLTEAVEVGSIQTAEISLHGTEDVTRAETCFLTGGRIDIQHILREVGVETGLCGVDFRTCFQSGGIVVHHIEEVTEVTAGFILHVQFDIAGCGVTRNHRRSKEQYLRFLDDFLRTHEKRGVNHR